MVQVVIFTSLSIIKLHKHYSANFIIQMLNKLKLTELSDVKFTRLENNQWF